jgi:S-adenosylmethionine:tRNA ribosyltransferase-isomerase
MDADDPRLDAFQYALPEGCVARYPPESRDGGRLLVREDGRWLDRSIGNLPLLFESGDLLVVNDTRVLAARLFGVRATGGKVEILVLDAASPVVSAMVRPGRRLKTGEVISLLDRSGAVSTFEAEMGELAADGRRTVRLSAPPMEVMGQCGHMPLPPYLEREATAADEERYQTVFADKPGAIAAPTASLHITRALIKRIEARGAQLATVTLHVGPGTFRNLRSTDLDRGALHVEQYIIPEAPKLAIDTCRAGGGRVTAVGTTVTRTLESAADGKGSVRAGEGETDLFIQPGYTFGVVDRLMTNFHIPRNSLLMLVSAFGGRESVLMGYAEAISQGYRFYSYGDAMFLDSAGGAL